MDEIQLYLEEAKDLMNKGLNHVAHELTKIRAGKANPIDAGWCYGFLLRSYDSA